MLISYAIFLFPKNSNHEIYKNVYLGYILFLSKNNIFTIGMTINLNKRRVLNACASHLQHKQLIHFHLIELLKQQRFPLQGIKKRDRCKRGFFWEAQLNIDLKLCLETERFNVNVKYRFQLFPPCCLNSTIFMSCISSGTVIYSNLKWPLNIINLLLQIPVALTSLF